MPVPPIRFYVVSYENCLDGFKKKILIILQIENTICYINFLLNCLDVVFLSYGSIYRKCTDIYIYIYIL